MNKERLISDFKRYLAYRKYKAVPNTLHILAGTTLRAEILGVVKRDHFTALKQLRGYVVADLNINHIEFTKVTEEFFNH